MPLFYINKFRLIILVYFFVCSFNFAQTTTAIQINNIKFNGNNFFSSSVLNNLILSKESPNWLSQFINTFSSFGSSPSFFDSLTVNNDISILTNFYKSNGFFKAKIYSEFSFNKNDKKFVDLIFNIDEGPFTRIRQFNFDGLDSLASELNNQLYKLIDTTTFIRYTDNIVEENNSIILNFLRDKGYMLAQAEKPLVKIDTVFNLVDIYLKFSLSKRYLISDVIVQKTGEGQDLVSNNLIKEIANIDVGSFYSYHNLKLAQIRLYRTNLFSSAIIAGIAADTFFNSVPIRIAADVSLLNELSPELIGINEDNVFKLGLGLSFINKNFFGGARKLTIGFSAAAQNITEFIKEADIQSDKIFGFVDSRISIEQPFLFGKPINTRFESYYTIEKKRNQWNSNILGAKLNFDFELPKYTYLTSFSSYITWQNAKYLFRENYLSNFYPDSLIIGAITTNTTNTVIGLNFIANKSNDLLFPTEGYSLSLLAEDGNSIPYLLSEIGNYKFNHAAYYKFVLTSTFYVPFESIIDVFATKFKIGNIYTYKGNPTNIPLNQRFTAGGSNSVRGWRANDLGLIGATRPENLTQEELNNIIRGITPGGFFLLEGSSEIRTHFSKLFGSAIFLDYGNVWNDFSRFRYDELAIAIGFGLRYYSEFAPIRLDLGFKLYNPQDRRSLFNRFNDTGGFLKNLEFQIGIGEAF